MSQQDFALSGDSYVDSDNPDTNYGSATYCIIMYDESGSKNYPQMRTWVETDFSGLGITDTSEVDSAYLYVYIYLVDGFLEHTVYWQDSPDFDEGTITWTNQPTPAGSTSDTKLVATTGWFFWDVTQIVKDSIGDGHFCVGGKSAAWKASQLNECWFYSDEVVSPDLPPYLRINYTLGAGGGDVAKISGVDWGDVKKVSGVAKANIKKVSGVTAN